MAQHPFPGDGHDGDQPLPGTPARDGADDGDAYMRWLIGEIDAGRIEVPPQGPPPGVTVSLGAAGDVGLEDLARMAQGLAGQGFAQNEAADAMCPGPVLGALTARAVEDMASLPDDELLGVVSAARRQQTHAEYEELAAIGEFTRRREEQYEASIARGDKPRHRDGEYADAELAMELGCSALTAGRRMDFSAHLSRRLPATFAGMAIGVISGYKAKLIYEFTRFLSDEQAAEADKILAEAAPGMNPGQLKDKAARLEMKLDPDGVQRRKEEAARKDRRVEARQEFSGNASLAGRELPVDDALAAKAGIWAEAVRLRNAGLVLPLREIRMIVFLDRLRGLNPWDRLDPPHDPPAGYDDPGQPGNPGEDEHPGDGDRDTGGQLPDDGYDFPDNGDDDAGERDDDRQDVDGGFPDDRFPDDGYDDGEEDEDEEDDGDGDEGDDGGDGDDDEDGGGGFGGGPPPGSPRSPAGAKTPLPARLHLTFTAATLLGWSDAPAEAAGFGLLDPRQARDLIAAASRHRRTRWCVTVTGEDGEAIAHGCARGQHPWNPPGERAGPARAGPDDQQAQLTRLLRQLGITLAPIAKGQCDHRHRENRYRPSRKLQHLVRARTAKCCAPGCNIRAVHCEIDHTTRYPDGTTCECNLGPPCSRHHHAKHAPGWKLEQPQPGVMRWTPPSGRTYTTTPTRYDA
jgi:hypothetical protein